MPISKKIFFLGILQIRLVADPSDGLFGAHFLGKDGGEQVRLFGSGDGQHHARFLYFDSFEHLWGGRIAFYGEHVQM
jgi:hypothetical protein